MKGHLSEFRVGAFVLIVLAFNLLLLPLAMADEPVYAANSESKEFGSQSPDQLAGIKPTISKQSKTKADTPAASTGLARTGTAKSSTDLKDVADMDLDELVKVRVSPFEVSTRMDTGYRASNSVSGSRFDTPIRDLPFAIQAFTESFIKDQKPVNIFDVARYSPGVTYRSNDFNEGNANLSIRGFAVSATPGNVQMLRDGLHGPSIFDFTNVSRVEVVKG
ncbi:MAG: TonB-dependent receptor plug domain-containing protein, partial [Methylobacter sp.]